MKAKIYFNMPDEEYRALPAISNSDLKLFSQNPEQYFYYKYKGFNPETDAKELGKAIHSYVLENETFFDKYEAISNDTRKTKKVKESTDKIILKQKDLDSFKAIKEKLDTDPQIKSVLENSYTEVVITWTSQAGLELKSRIDALSLSYITDLKSIGRTMDGAFRNTIEECCKEIKFRKYDNQCWFYDLAVRELIASLNTGDVDLQEYTRDQVEFLEQLKLSSPKPLLIFVDKKEPYPAPLAIMPSWGGKYAKIGAKYSNALIELEKYQRDFGDKKPWSTNSGIQTIDERLIYGDYND